MSDDQAMDAEVDEALDATGLTCPMPLLKAKQALNRMTSGQVLSVISTDAGSVRDFAVFARQSGHELLKSEAHEGQFLYWLKKA